MKRLGHEISILFVDYKNSFLTKRVFVLFALLFFVINIYLQPIRKFSRETGYDVSAGCFVFLLFDLYFSLVFIFACIYFFSNVPFLTYHQSYRIVRMGKLKWGIHQILNIFISAVLLIAVIAAESILILAPRISWDNNWGKIIYTLSLTNMGEQYGVQLNFDYNIIKSYSPYETVGLVFLVGTLMVCFLGNMMFVLSLYFSRTAALSVASIEAAFIIMLENMYLFPKMIFITPFSWIRLDKILYLQQNHMPAPSILQAILYLLAGNGICILLALIRIRHMGYSKYVKKE